MSTGAAYLTIQNTGAEADRLTGAETDVAQVVEIHEVKDVDGVMQMSPLKDGLEIPAGETVELKPGGYHIMYAGLKEDLTVGKTYALTLHFEHAGDVEITVEVRLSAETGMGTPVAVTSGDLIVSNAWSRIAPAMNGDAASPAATPDM
jgi:copper(I)-binding protein